MRLFRDYLMPWWEVGLLKAYVFAIGLLVGAYFSDAVMPFTTLLLIIVAVLAVYFVYKLITIGFRSTPPPAFYIYTHTPPQRLTTVSQKRT